MTDKDDTTRIGQRVADIRHSKKLSQRALAELAHVPPTQITNIESATHSPSVKTLSKVLNAMGYRLAIIPKETTPIG